MRTTGEGRAKKAAAYTAPLYEEECTKGIAASSFRNGMPEEDEREERRRRDQGEREPEHSVLICHRPLRGPFRILDQRQSYANPPLSSSRVFGGGDGRGMAGATGRIPVSKGSMSLDRLDRRQVCL